jgi:hypothetical protein
VLHDDGEVRVVMARMDARATAAVSVGWLGEGGGTPFASERHEASAQGSST